MAGVPEKARFYLERAVPILRELEEREIFTKADLRTILTRLTTHEHAVLAPRNTPGVWAAYLDWISQLTTLVTKRATRLGIHLTASSHASRKKQKKNQPTTAKHSRSPSLLPALKGWLYTAHERSVSRHPGATDLWRAYLSALERDGATRRWRKAATRALRMHPAAGDLWTYVAQRTAEGLSIVDASGDGEERRGVGDMERARAVWVRACAFCCTDATGGPEVWAGYARGEMRWLRGVEEKLRGRRARKAVTAASADTVEHVVLEDLPGETELREALGAGGKRAAEDEDADLIRFDASDEDDVDDDGRLVLPDLPDTTSKQVVPSSIADKPGKPNPVLEGALPRAIFAHSLTQQFASPLACCAAFFDVFAAHALPSSAAFVSCAPGLARHVLDTISERFGAAGEPTRLACWTREPVAAVELVNSAEFVRGLREVLARLAEVRGGEGEGKRLKGEDGKGTSGLQEYEALVVAWIERVRDRGAQERAEGLDEAVAEVFEAVLGDLRNVKTV